MRRSLFLLVAPALIYAFTAAAGQDKPSAQQNQPLAPTLAAPQASQEATDYATYFNRGNLLMQQMQFREAVEEFREAARLNLAYLPPHQALAMAYARTGNFAMAWKEVRLLRQSSVALPERFIEGLSAEMSEAEAVRRQQSIEADLVDAQIAVNEQPRDPAASAKLADALEKAGAYAGARHEAERALQLDPAQPDAHLLLARILIGEPQTRSEAIPHLKTYLQKAPRTPDNLKNVVDAYRILGDIYMRSGANPQALETYEEGLKAAPEEAGMWNNAAWIYATATEASLRNPAKALAYARKAVDLSQGKRPGFLDTLAEALFLNGEVDQAIDTEKKALALAPDNEFMRDQLAKFEKAKQQAKPLQP